MAITVNSTPSTINPAYREVKWTVTSNDPNIKAIRADLYIGSTYTSTIDGVQVLGSSSQFTFDIRKLMQSILKSELRTNITTFQVTDATTSAKTVKLRLYEIIETAGVFTTTWADNGLGTGYVETGTVDVVNMATQHQETLSDWTVDDATKKLLTLRSDNNRIPRGVPFQVGFISSDTNLVGVYATYDANLNLITTANSSVLASLTSSKGIIEIPTSLYSNTNVAFIDIHIIKNAIGARSITYRYKVVDLCDLFTVFIQNHLGGFDHFDFGHKVTTNISTKNQTMKKPLPSGFSVDDGGSLVISSKTKTKVKVNSGQLSASELTFLSEFVKNHSVVYKWDSAGNFLRYILKSHSTKVEDNDKLINSISLTLAPSNEHIVQNGD